MKNQLFLLLICLLHTAGATAQTLLPYLGANGKYGYADELGKVAIQPVFETPGDIIPPEKIFAYLPSADGRQPALLLRTGRIIPVSKPNTVAVGVRNYTADGQPADSISHLAALFDGRELTLYDLRSNTGKTYQNVLLNNSDNWFTGFSKPAREHLAPFQFFHGFAEVWKSKDVMNFVDANLKEIFPRDFAAGRVADAGHFILAERQDRLAVGDRTGRVRTPFVWTSIRPGGRDGHFIVQGPHYPHKKSGITGLMDADGHIIIDTIYRSIKPFGPYLIVEKDGLYGLMDHTGNTVRPMAARSMYPVARQRLLLIDEYDGNGGNARSNLLDREGKLLLPETVRSIGNLDSREFPHFWVHFSDYDAIYDTALNRIATFKGFDSGEIVESKPFVFKLSKINGTGYEFGLYDREGALLHPAGFDELAKVFPNLYRVKKDSLVGVINSKGEPVIPINYLSVRAETNARDSLFWCEQQNGRWTAYRLKDRKVFEDPQVILQGYNDPIAAFKQAPGNGPVTAVFEGGLRRTVPDSLKSWRLQRQIRTPNGGLFVYSRYQSDVREVLYLDEQFQNIVPSGFVAQSDNEPTGLVTVMRIRPAAKLPASSQSPSPEGSKVMEEPPAGKRQEALRSPEFDACGVLYANGQWALPPRAGVTYRPLSAFLVLETPNTIKYKPTGIYPGKLRLHRVNQPARPPVEVDFIRNDGFEKGYRTIQMGRVIPKTTDQIALAYFDDKGNQLTPFGVYQGPVRLKSRNIITLVDFEKRQYAKLTAIDREGKTLFEFDNLSCSKMPHSTSNDWKFDYVVVTEQLSRREEERIAKMPAAELNELLQKHLFPQGILDSTGRLVQPLKYFSLQIVAPDRLFAARDTTGTALLYNWQGELLHRFPDRPVSGYLNSDAVSVLSLKNGNFVIGDGLTSVLVSPGNRIIKVFKYSHNGSVDGSGRFFQMTAPDQKTYWVRASDGWEYRQGG